MNWLIENWKAIGVIAVTIEHAAIGVYVTVAHAGGLRTLWSNFMGPKAPLYDGPVDTHPITGQPPKP